MKPLYGPTDELTYRGRDVLWSGGLNYMYWFEGDEGQIEVFDMAALFFKWPYCLRSELVMLELDSGIDMEELWDNSPFKNPITVEEDL